MIATYTAEEIELIRASNLLVSKTLAEIGKQIKPGVTSEYLDKIAENYIRDNGGEPGFLGYQGFPKSICTSINEQVVHGIPSAQSELKEGDIISVDCGVYMNDFYGDSAYTFAVGEVSDEKKKLMAATKESLFEGVKMATVGNRTG
ncbi:MAG: M24 family metallopeptidase, partial [Bacteroidales bacterium]|nr:M24 family metallopeptidase [Bacteroidales bacterium]